MYNGTTNYTGSKLALRKWANLAVHTVTAGAASTVEVTMNGTSIYRSTTASLGTSGIRTIQIGNDKQLPFALYGANILALGSRAPKEGDTTPGDSEPRSRSSSAPRNAVFQATRLSP